MGRGRSRSRTRSAVPPTDVLQTRGGRAGFPPPLEVQNHILRRDVSVGGNSEHPRPGGGGGALPMVVLAGPVVCRLCSGRGDKRRDTEGQPVICCPGSSADTHMEPQELGVGEAVNTSSLELPRRRAPRGWAVALLSRAYNCLGQSRGYEGCEREGE